MPCENVMSASERAGSSRTASILNGDFTLQTVHAELLELWQELADGIPRRHCHDGLIPFRKKWWFRQESGTTTWRLTSGEDLDVTTPDASVETLLARLEYFACGEVLRYGGDALPVHAALVAPSSAGVIAITGVTQAGKSTVSTALWDAGWELFCDDRCFIAEHDTSTPETIPIPRRISLRPPSLDLFNPKTKDAILQAPLTGTTTIGDKGEIFRYNFRPTMIRPEPEDQCFRLRAVVHIDPDAPSSSMEQMEPTQMLKPLLACTAIQVGQKTVETLLPWISILNAVPVFRTGRAPLPLMKDNFFKLVNQL